MKHLIRIYLIFSLGFLLMSCGEASSGLAGDPVVCTDGSLNGFNTSFNPYHQVGLGAQADQPDCVPRAFAAASGNLNAYHSGLIGGQTAPQIAIPSGGEGTHFTEIWNQKDIQKNDVIYYDTGFPGAHMGHAAVVTRPPNEQGYMEVATGWDGNMEYMDVHQNSLHRHYREDPTKGYGQAVQAVQTISSVFPMIGF